MPSFLSKVFGRKKDGKGSPTSRGRGSDGSLLDGKFEAVSPTVSPSVTEFPENAHGANGREKEKDAGFGLFKVKSRPSRPSSPELPHRRDDLPQLSLVLPVPKDDAQARTLGVVFEADPDTQILTDVTIGNRRLTPLEALILVRTCSQAIIARGLETLGLMHPHWYSASPETQRRLISLFIHSLNPNNAITTLSPTSASHTSVFESEVNYTHSPHDVAAVLRWGLRHLELSGGCFGKEQSWYRTFAEAERKSEYPPKAYSETLNPLIPPAHLELLDVTLDLFSSLAAHSEKNSTSASKLTKAFGLWLLAAQRVDDKDDWPKFYARWQSTGRIMEHLFLARIRDESLRVRMPTRLTELVSQYPFEKGPTTDDDVFLRPRLSTRQFEALFVRVESEFSSPEEKVQRHPLQFIKDAFTADVAGDGNDYSSLWEKIRKSGNDENDASPGGYPGLSRVFADETIRYLTLIPGDHPWKKVTSPTFSITEVFQDTSTPRRYASSPGPGESSSKAVNGTTNGHVKPASDPTPIPSAAASPLDTDWSQFSSAGFSDVSPSVTPLASTLFGQDVEKTNPPFRKSSKRSKVPSRTPSAGRKSTDVAAPRISNVSQPDAPKPVYKSIPVSLVQIDEAFIDFWVDSLLDPIASNWPKFVLCKFKSSLTDLTVNDKRIEYLVIEHVFVPKPLPPAPTPAESVEPAEAVSSPEKSAAPSPRSSTKSEKRFFGFFTSSNRSSSYITEKLSSTTNKGKKKTSPPTGVSELGEVVKELKNEKQSTTVKLRVPSPKPRKSVDASRKSADVARKSVDVSEQAPGKSTEEKKDESAEAAAVAIASTSADGIQPPTLPQAEESSKRAEEAARPIEEAQPNVAQFEKVAEQGPATSTVVHEVEKVDEQAPARVLETITETTVLDDEPTAAAAVEKVEELAEQPLAPIVEEPVPAPVEEVHVEETALAPPVEVVQNPIEEAHVFSTAEVVPEQPALAEPVAEEVSEAVTVEEPVVETQAPQEPEVSAAPELAVAEEPVPEPIPAEEPVVHAAEESVPSHEASVEEATASEPTPVIEEPTKDIIAVEEPTVEHASALEVPATVSEEAPAVEATVLEPVAAEEPASVPVQEATVVEERVLVDETIPIVEEEAPVEIVAAEEQAPESVVEDEEPVAESAVVEEEPVTESAVAEEEPAVEAVAVNELAPAEESPPVEEPAPTSAPVPEEHHVIEEPIVVGETETPAPEEPIVEEITIEAPAAEIVPDDQPTAAEEPAATPAEESATADEPAAAEESVSQEHVVVEEPDVVEEMQAIEEPVDEPAPVEVAKESSEAEVPTAADVEEPALAEEAIVVEEPATPVVEEATPELVIEQEAPAADEPVSEEPTEVVKEPQASESVDVAVNDEIPEEPTTTHVDPVSEAAPTETLVEEPEAPTAPEDTAEPESTETKAPSHEDAPTTVEISHEEAIAPPLVTEPEAESTPVEAEEKLITDESPVVHEPIAEPEPSADPIETADEPAESLDAAASAIDEDAIVTSAPAVADDTPTSAPETAEPVATPSIAAVAEESTEEAETSAEPPATSSNDIVTEETTTNGEAASPPAPEVANGNGHHTIITEKEDVAEEIPVETLPTDDDKHDIESTPTQTSSEPITTDSAETASTTAKDD